MVWLNDNLGWDVLAKATSLRLHRRLANAVGPVTCGLSRENIEKASEGLVDDRSQQGWISRLASAMGCQVQEREAKEAAPDAPLLVADRMTRSVAFLQRWPAERKIPSHGRDWEIALAVAHQALHWPPRHLPSFSTGIEDELMEGDTMLYVPHYISASSPYAAARREAMWYAAALVMPTPLLVAAWRRNKGDASGVARDLAIEISPDLLSTRARSLGL